MRKNRVQNILILIVIIFASCRKVQNTEPFFDEGRIENDTYINDTIGWKMSLPVGWDLTRRITEELKNEYINLANSAEVEYLNMSSHRQLLALEKDQFNVFRSSYEKVKDVSNVTLYETMQAYSELIPSLFPSPVQFKYCSPIKKKGIKGVSFLYFSYECFMPAPIDKKLYGMAYMGVVKNYLLEITINYTDKQNEKEIMDAWLKSTFL